MVLTINLEDYDVIDENGIEEIEIDIDDHIDEILDSEDYFDDWREHYDGWCDEHEDEIKEDAINDLDESDIEEIAQEKGFVCIPVEEYRGEYEADKSYQIQRTISNMTRNQKHDFFCDILGLMHHHDNQSIANALLEELA